jgi:hypothetical protein
MTYSTGARRDPADPHPQLLRGAVPARGGAGQRSHGQPGHFDAAPVLFCMEHCKWNMQGRMGMTPPATRPTRRRASRRPPPSRHSDPQPLLLGPQKYSRWRTIPSVENSSEAQVKGKIYRVDPDFGSTLTVSNKDSQSNFWVNRKIMGQPCEFQA